MLHAPDNRYTNMVAPLAWRACETFLPCLGRREGRGASTKLLQASDVFMLGCTFLEVLTGGRRQPYDWLTAEDASGAALMAFRSGDATRDVSPLQAADAAGVPVTWAVAAGSDSDSDAAHVLFVRLLAVVTGCVTPDPASRWTVSHVLDVLTGLQRDIAAAALASGVSGVDGHTDVGRVGGGAALNTTANGRGGAGSDDLQHTGSTGSVAESAAGFSSGGTAGLSHDGAVGDAPVGSPGSGDFESEGLVTGSSQDPQAVSSGGDNPLIDSNRDLSETVTGFPGSHHSAEVQLETFAPLDSNEGAALNLSAVTSQSDSEPTGLTVVRSALLARQGPCQSPTPLPPPAYRYPCTVTVTARSVLALSLSLPRIDCRRYSLGPEHRTPVAVTVFDRLLKRLPDAACPIPRGRLRSCGNSPSSRATAWPWTLLAASLSSAAAATPTTKSCSCTPWSTARCCGAWARRAPAKASLTGAGAACA